MLGVSDLGPEGIGCSLEGLGYSLLSEDFVLKIVLAGVTVTPASDAIEPTCKAFAVQLEAPTVAAVAPSERFGRRLQMFYRWLRRVKRCVVTSVKIRGVYIDVCMRKWKNLRWLTCE